jgi:CheY-like chemotaxis protein
MTTDPRSRLKVLLVEDVAGFSSIFSDWLKAPNVDFDVTGSGRHAIWLMQSTRYDLAFLDVHLPDLDAVAVVQLARAKNIVLPRLFAITGDGREETRQACIEAGFIAVWVKPILHSQFAELIEIEKLHHDLFT